MHIRLMAAAVLCALVAVGCSSASIVPQPRKTAAPATTAPAASACQSTAGLIAACQRFGNLTTIDPCSLITLSALPPDLAAAPDGRQSLDYCAFHITQGPAKNAELRVGSLENEADAQIYYFNDSGEQLQPEGLNLVQGKPHDNECDDALEFGGDQVYLDVAVYFIEGAASQSLCDAADEVGKAVGTVIDSTTQVQHFTVPKNSVATVKACELLNGKQIGGATLDGRTETPSGHHCDWQPNLNVDEYFGVELTIGTDLTGVASSHSQIDGLATYTIKTDGSQYSTCVVSTNRGPWGDPGSRLLQSASVSVQEPAGKIGTACADAAQMAAIVWPQLPPVS